MRQSPKIATCCYCGTRAALVLKGETRHELACSACGAPLHNLKHLSPDHVIDKSRAGRPKKRPEMAAKSPKRMKKKKKSFGSWMFEEALDALEDIFD
ncbi:MAG: hypothetical protein AAGM21_11370 [Pseudomonadota bacterium]